MGPTQRLRFIGDKQRWLCKNCGCKYTRSTPHGKPEALKRQALQLYLEGMGFRAIGRELNVSNVAVLKWIRGFGEGVERLRKTEGALKVASLADLRRFVSDKLKNSEDMRCAISADGSTAYVWRARAEGQRDGEEAPSL